MAQTLATKRKIAEISCKIHPGCNIYAECLITQFAAFWPLANLVPLNRAAVLFFKLSLVK
ncbi:MAG: hypothetical protein DU429_02885 [Candidatus Tokpelaia sp.]|nr:MAG: hypothetical protein DU430_05640 [Candidatus Tokpelaia sp.]KAA6207412.1 MAG: hypothetical protein DU429_02885 [Candidatus Tokpelaia sp.]